MKTSKRVSWILLAMAIVTIIFAPPRLSAQTATAKSSSGNGASGAVQWSVQVDKVNPGDVDIEPAFRVAIYENLVDELGKTKRFQQVFREVHGRQRDSTRCDHRERCDKVNRAQPTVHSRGPGHSGTYGRRQCPFSGEQLASNPQPRPQCGQDNQTISCAGALALSSGTGCAVTRDQQ